MTRTTNRGSRAPRLGGTRAPCVVIAGGGVAALEAMIALGHAKTPLDVMLLSERAALQYKPLAVREPFGHRLPAVPLAPLVVRHGARWSRAKLESVDTQRHRIWLAGGAALRYDALIVATGAARRAPRPQALTLGGDVGGSALGQLVKGLESGAVETAAFAVPSRGSWSLPIYELALQTSAHLLHRGIDQRLLTVVTPEPAPLALFGPRASEMLSSRLAESGVELRVATYPFAASAGELEVVPGRPVPAEAVVWGSAVEPQTPDGLPVDDRGFLPTDRYGRVAGADDVYAAGDVTGSLLKQGGLAAQQAASAAASVIAAANPGAEPQPFTPVLRAVLLTGSDPLYLRTPLEPSREEPVASSRPLWPHDQKIVTRHLAPELRGVATRQPWSGPA